MPSPRGGLLCSDVDYMVKTGKTINVPKSDELNKLKRYLFRNKRKMAVAATGLGATAIVAGPLALGVVAIAVSGKAITFALTRAWRAARRYVAQSSIDDFREEMSAGGKSSGVTTRDSKGLLSVSPEYATILQDVRYLCSHGGLTDTFNAFSELERDYDACQKWQATVLSGDISSCKDAVSMWEIVSRVHYRFEAIKPVFALIDDMVMYTVLELSRMEDEFNTNFAYWLRTFKRGTDSTAERLAILNTAANQDAVNHTRGLSFGRTVDYTNWLRQALPPAARQELGLVGPHANPSSASDAPLAMASAIGTDVAISQTLGTAKEFGGQVATKSLHGGKILEAAVPMNAAGIVGVGETVLGTLAEKGNDYVNMQKYETKKTSVLYFFYRRDQTKREQVGTLRKLAKDNLEAFIDKFEHWVISHKEWKEERSAYAPTMAVRLLRRQKHALQVAQLSKFVYEFHDTLVHEGNLMSLSVEKTRERAKEIIEKWVDNHPPSHVCEGHCYASVLHGLRGIGVSMDPVVYRQSEARWNGAPVWRVTENKSALETVVKKLDGILAV